MSIQSAVSYGHVGNSAAVFPLQRRGHEVMPVYTVCYSNHTGYGEWGGPMLSGDDVRAVVAGIDNRSGLDDCELVLSGYQGGDSIGDAVLDAVALTKKRNPAAIYACDPVLGSADKGCFVSAEVQKLIRDRVIPKADIATPNQFELGFLTDRSPVTLEETLDAAEALRAKGPSTVLVTSVMRPDRAEGTIEMLAVGPQGAYLVATPHLPVKYNGSGDVTAALFASSLVESGDLEHALQTTAASVYDLVENTYKAGTKELQLVESQDAYVAPRSRFVVRKLR